MCHARGSEVMVEFMQDYEGIVKVFAVGEVDGCSFCHVACWVFGVAFGHAHFQLWRGHLVILA